MSTRERQLARLLRALIACCALLFAFEAPSFAAGAARDTSSWIAERVSAATATRPALRAPGRARRAARQQRIAPAPSFVRPALPASSEQAARGGRASVDARRLYLDLRRLLC